MSEKAQSRPQLPRKDDFLLYLQTNDYSKETLENYERDLSVFEHFLVDDWKKSFRTLNKRGMERFKVYLRSRDRRTGITGMTSSHELAAASINRCLSSLRGYLRYCIEMEENVPILPEHVKLVRLPRPHPRVAEYHQLVRLLESPTEFEKRTPLVALRNRAMLEMLFATGMRISELVGLNRSQIDDSGKIFITGKGRKQRFVYLTPRATKHLTAYLRFRRDAHPALFVPSRGANAGKSTARISPNYLQMKIKQYRERLRINVPTSAHSLRHGFATYLAERGANPAAIQILLGHESLETTTRYVHASDRYAAEVHRQFHPLKDDS